MRPKADKPTATDDSRQRVRTTYGASAVAPSAFATVTVVSGQSISETGSASRRLMQLVPIPTDTAPEFVAVDPYTSTADALNEAVLQAQIARLNPFDQSIVRRRLGLALGTQRTEHHAEALLHEERALGKLRHPSVTRPANDNLSRSLA
jgi:hypothetical protein